MPHLRSVLNLIYLYIQTNTANKNTKLGVFHPVVCTCNSILYLTVGTQQCGATPPLCSHQLSDMPRPYRVTIRLYKTMVIRHGTCGSITCRIPWFAFKYLDLPFFILVDGMRLTGVNSKLGVFHPVVCTTGSRRQHHRMHPV